MNPPLPFAAAAPLTCEIHAGPAAAADLAEIVRFCAREIGQPVELIARHARGEPAVVLQLSAEQAAAQHPVWCLACRLACFCPNARVSVLVQAPGAFARAAGARTADAAARAAS